ncbi:MAG: putative cell division protein ytgP [Bacillales bacterium]|jgi:PST family polysaccharide transporter|nr:putative cell division protein ytgP [Bacillales bacterium]
MADSKFIRGTLIVTLGTFFIKFLGMIYVIPLYSLIGEKGGALYTYGYSQYLIFLSISTMGIPLAVSKFVSKYNSLGDYYTSRRLFKSAFTLMLATGVGFFLILYNLAPFIAEISLGSEELSNSVEDVTYVIRMVSFALILVPVMSIIRGFFQGHQSMGPTTVSQIVEQIVRIAFLLGAAFYVLKILDGTITKAVGYATFAAFVGALGGLLVLIYYWFKRKKHLDELLTTSNNFQKIPYQKLYKELLIYAIPFVFVGIAMPIYQYIDVVTFNRTMVEIGQGSEAEKQLGIINMYAQKLVMIPVSLATAMGLTLVPAITKSFTENDLNSLKSQITKTFEIILFLTIPAVVGLSILAEPAYSVFYSYSETGSMLLAWYAPAALGFALFSVTISILQGMNLQKFAMISLGLGISIKLVLNIPLIMLLEGRGSIIATALGFGISVAYNLLIIKKHAKYSYRAVLRRFAQTSIFTLLMGISVLVVNSGLNKYLSTESGKGQGFIILIVGVSVGVLVYGYLSLGSGLAGHVLGSRFNFLKKKLPAKNN